MSDGLNTPSDRLNSLTRLSAAPFDVLVIGGGIVGAGVARDAAMRGLSTALVERADFASGTSSRSSRLLHGGLRYLAQGRLRLVREAGAEKMVLRRIAPHLTRPMPFVFPTYRGTEWKLWKLRIGVKIYDWLSAGRNFDASGSLRPAETGRLLPGLNSNGLTGAVRYFDAVTSDARLVLDTLRSAARHGATVLNYTSFDSADRRGDAWRCRVTDRLSGTSRECSARTIVNAAGAWGDRFPQSRVKLRLTKGVHLVVHRERLPVPECAVMTERSRILFAIPWGERTVLGTTDTDYAGDLDSPACEPADAQYILGVANEFFPAANLNPDDVTSTWAGLRPLVADPSGRPSDISRAHEIHMTQPGWIDVAGGKLTTYRLMAEQTVDRIVAFCKAAAAPCATAIEPLLRASDDAPFGGIIPPDVSREAVEHYCRHEWAVHSDDVLLRRSGWQHYVDDPADVGKRVRRWMEDFADRSPVGASAGTRPIPAP